MPSDENPERALIDSVRTATGNALTVLLHDSDEETIHALLENPHLEEEHLCLLLERLDLPASILEIVASKHEWLRSERVKLRLARHPHTPHRIAVGLVRQIYLFDLMGLSQSPSTPPEIRRLAEEAILAKIPQLPLGQKITLARRGPSRVAGALIAEGHPQALKLALNNSLLTESQILKVLAKPDIAERVVAAIAQHPKWSLRYNVRLALLREPRTPYPVQLAFLPDLTVRDLREIAEMNTISPRLREHIRRELANRPEGETGTTAD